jgi:hypothetical protein
MTAGAKIQLGGGNATSIQGVPVSSTAPVPGQALIDVGGVYTPGTVSAGAMSLISSQVLASSAASVTFSAIPQTFNHLKLVARARSNYAGTVDGFQVNINGLGTATYAQDTIQSIGGGNAVQHVASTTQIWWIAGGSAADLPAQTLVAGIWGNLNIDLFNYARTDAYPNGQWESGFVGTAPDACTFVGHLMQQSSASSVTSMVLSTADASTYQIGSTFYLYGIT